MERCCMYIKCRLLLRRPCSEVLDEDKDKMGRCRI
jgi:hypothetical protein